MLFEVTMAKAKKAEAKAEAPAAAAAAGNQHTIFCSLSSSVSVTKTVL